MEHLHGGGVGEGGREGGGAGPGWVVCSFIYSLCLYRRKIHYGIILYHLALLPFTTVLLDMWGGPFTMSEHACMQSMQANM